MSHTLWHPQRRFGSHRSGLISTFHWLRKSTARSMKKTVKRLKLHWYLILWAACPTPLKECPTPPTTWHSPKTPWEPPFYSDEHCSLAAQSNRKIEDESGVVGPPPRAFSIWLRPVRGPSWAPNRRFLSGFLKVFRVLLDQPRSRVYSGIPGT